MLGVEPTGALGALDRAEARERVAELSERYGLAVDPDAIGRGPAGRRAAAGRDPQGALPRRPLPHPRRAHRGAHAARDRRADGHHPPARRRAAGRSSSSATSCARCVDDRRPHHRAAPAARSWASTTPAEADEQALATMMVGRDVQLVVDKEPADAGEPVLDGRRPRRRRRPRPPRRRRRVARRAGGRDPGHRRRAGQRPDRAGRGHHRPARRRERARSRLDGADVTGAAPDQLFARRRWPTSPRTASATGWSASFPVAVNMVLNQIAQAAVLPRAAHRPPGRARATPPTWSTSSTCAPRRSTPPRRRCRAATSRRSSSPASSSTPDRLLVLSQPTRGLDVGLDPVHPPPDRGQARRGRRPCCSTPPSSTRCWPWPTASP